MSTCETLDALYFSNQKNITTIKVNAIQRFVLTERWLTFWCIPINSIIFLKNVAVFCDEWTAWNEVVVAEFQSILVLIGKETQLLKNFTFIFQAYLNAYHFMERQLNSLQLWQQRNDFRSSFFCCSAEKEERGVHTRWPISSFFSFLFPPSFFFFFFIYRQGIIEHICSTANIGMIPRWSAEEVMIRICICGELKEENCDATFSHLFSTILTSVMWKETLLAYFLKRNNRLNVNNSLFSISIESQKKRY